MLPGRAGGPIRIGDGVRRSGLALRIGVRLRPILENAPSDVFDDTVERGTALRTRYVENRRDGRTDAPTFANRNLLPQVGEPRHQLRQPHIPDKLTFNPRIRLGLRPSPSSAASSSGPPSRNVIPSARHTSSARTSLGSCPLTTLRIASFGNPCASAARAAVRPVRARFTAARYSSESRSTVVFMPCLSRDSHIRRVRRASAPLAAYRFVLGSPWAARQGRPARSEHADWGRLHAVTALRAFNGIRRLPAERGHNRAAFRR